MDSDPVGSVGRDLCLAIIALAVILHQAKAHLIRHYCAIQSELMIMNSVVLVVSFPCTERYTQILAMQNTFFLLPKHLALPSCTCMTLSYKYVRRSFVVK